MFVNRTDELDALGRWWDDTSSHLAVVWGRRRVGKTALLRQFADDKAAIFHTGAARGEQGELALLSHSVSALQTRADTRDLATRPYRDWDDALDDLAALATDRPLLVVLDEFPELAATSPELPNVLRAFLDRSRQRTHLRVVLAGSAVRYMTQLGEERHPLYGRADLTLQLQPFRPWEAALMLETLPPAERALVYGLVGGVPLYLSWWDQNGSVTENLQALAGEPGAHLLNEGDFVLATEVETGEYPRAVLYAIATGKTRHNEIKMAIDADPTRTLDRLIALRLIERLQPVTEAGRSRRRSYRIADNFLAFHLGVLARYRTEIELGLGPSIVPVMVDGLDDHLGHPWEAAVRTHLRRMAAEGAYGESIVAVGPWWKRDGSVEIDAVALVGRHREPVLAAEAKWARRIHGRRHADALARKARNVPGIVDEPALVLAAREHVDTPPERVHTVTAADVFSTT